MTLQWPKRQNLEKQKQSKTRIQTKNVDIGLQIKINDTIGSLSYIMSIFLINIFVEQIESSNPWQHLFKQEKLNNVEAIIKRCKRNIDISQKFL
jgi:hypothetical protein